MGHKAEHMVKDAGNDVRKFVSGTGKAVGTTAFAGASAKQLRAEAQDISAQTAKNLREKVASGELSMTENDITRTANAAGKAAYRQGQRNMLKDVAFKKFTGMDRGMLHNDGGASAGMIGQQYVDQDGNVATLTRGKIPKIARDTGIKQGRIDNAIDGAKGTYGNSVAKPGTAEDFAAMDNRFHEEEPQKPGPLIGTPWRAKRWWPENEPRD